jgi:phosphoribosylformylglycinamidine synthase
VEIADSPLQELFSETYGRFLVAFADETVFCDLPYRVIGEVGGDGLVCRAGKERFTLSLKDQDQALSSLTRLMRY